MDAGWVALVPPLVTLAVAVVTRHIIPSLVLGLLVGAVLVSGSLPLGVIRAAEYIVASLGTAESVYIVLFLFMFGALTETFKMAGGIKGFGRLAERYVRDERGALLSVWMASTATFLDCCFHAIATGTIARPLVEKAGGSREKLAMVVNTTSSQLIVLIPIATTYVGYVIGVITSAARSAGIETAPYVLYLQSIPFNFYSIGMVILSLLIIYLGMGFGRWRFGRAGVGGGGVHGGHEAHEQCAFEQEMPPRAANLLLPLTVLVGLIVLLFWWTGRGDGRSFLQALMNAEFEKAIFVATFGTLVVTAVFYALQRIPIGEMESHFLSGGTDLLPPIVVLVLSWSLASAAGDLGFAEFVASTIGDTIPTVLIPATVFLVGTLTSYFIGSSWATWALVMPLGLPLAAVTGASLPLTVGAVLAGGSVGDNVSPLGETPVLTSAVTGVPLLEHVQTTLPYALVVIAISTMLFVLVQALLG